MRHSVIAALMGLLASGWACTAFGYEVRTHRILTSLAVNAQKADLESVLQEAVGRRVTLDSPLRGPMRQLSFRDWLLQGSEEEDALSLPRCLNHFHDPTQPLATAGLFHERTWASMSSIDWALLPRLQQALRLALVTGTMADYHSMSWSDARFYYAQALTAEDADARQQYLALTLKALGHVMHLVQDASVPSHVRNDAHLPYFGDADDFHAWVDGNTSRWLVGASVPVTPDPSLLHPTTARTDALSPLANLFDADIFTGSAAGTPGVVTAMWSAHPTAGIAEIANASFFSEDSMESAYSEPFIDCTQMRNFLSPPASHEFCQFPGFIPSSPTVSSMSHWLERAGAGRVVDKLALRSFSRLGTGTWFSSPSVESDEIHAEYARLLTPRAVGYSGEVPAYFFRGRLSAAWDDAGMISVTNQSQHSQDVMEGTLKLYATGDDGRRWLVQEWLLEPLSPGDSTVLGVEQAAEAANSLSLVFQGKLGLEPDAIAATTLCPKTTPVARAGTWAWDVDFGGHILYSSDSAGLVHERDLATGGDRALGRDRVDRLFGNIGRVVAGGYLAEEGFFRAHAEATPLDPIIAEFPFVTAIPNAPAVLLSDYPLQGWGPYATTIWYMPLAPQASPSLLAQGEVLGAWLMKRRGLVAYRADGEQRIEAFDLATGRTLDRFTCPASPYEPNGTSQQVSAAVSADRALVLCGVAAQYRPPEILPAINELYALDARGNGIESTLLARGVSSPQNASSPSISLPRISATGEFTAAEHDTTHVLTSGTSCCDPDSGLPYEWVVYRNQSESRYGPFGSPAPVRQYLHRNYYDVFTDDRLSEQALTNDGRHLALLINDYDQYQWVVDVVAADGSPLWTLPAQSLETSRRIGLLDSGIIHGGRYYAFDGSNTLFLDQYVVLGSDVGTVNSFSRVFESPYAVFQQGSDLALLDPRPESCLAGPQTIFPGVSLEENAQALRTSADGNVLVAVDALGRVHRRLRHDLDRDGIPNCSDPAPFELGLCE